ncbi:MAG: long-chain fatty acid--CoA ligase [Acidobacteriota bacterium]
MAEHSAAFAHRTLADFVVFLRQAHGSRERFFTVVRDDGELEAFSCETLMARVHALVAAFEHGRLEPGDRVAIYAENRPEWHLIDFACQLFGAVSVPIYPDLPADQVGYIVRDSGAAWVAYSGASRRAVLEDLVGWLDPAPLLLAIDRETAPADGVVLDDLLAHGALRTASLPWDALRERVSPDDLSSLLYTSVTTGQPKGVMLTHGNLASNLLAACEVYPGPGGAEEQAVCFLPLSHVFARTTCHTFLNLAIAIHYVQDVEALPEALMRVRPTVMASVPLVFETAFTKIHQAIDDDGGAKKTLFDWAVEGGRHVLDQKLEAGSVGLLASARRAVADRLVFKKILDRFGGRLRFVVAGGAPLPEQVEIFFQAVGVGIYQGYGLTETSPMVTINYPGRYRPGSTGATAPGVEIRLAEDGEILVHGPGVMRGYWRLPEATAEVLGPDGWFRTGDVGAIDDDGFLFITGRKKEIIVTSNGDNIAPVPIEHLLAAAPVVAQALVVGDDRPHLGALVVPDWDRLGLMGRPEDLVDDDKVVDQLRDVVASVNRLLPEHEKVRCLGLVPRPFTVDSGELTPTLKIRRAVVLERQQETVDRIYAPPT